MQAPSKVLSRAAWPLMLALAGSATASAQNAPLPLTQAEQTTVYRSIVRERVATHPARPAASRQAGSRNDTVVRTTTRERIVTRPAVTQTPPVRERIVTAPAATVVEEPLGLTPTERQFVYRGVVAVPPPASQRVVTRPLATPVPVVEESVAIAPPAAGVYAGGTTGASAEFVDEPVTIIVPAPPVSSPATAQEHFELAVGTRVPTSVPLYAMPQTIAAQVPSVAPYYYAVIDERVYLVDPRDQIVVGMLYR